MSNTDKTLWMKVLLMAAWLTCGLAVVPSAWAVGGDVVWPYLDGVAAKQEAKASAVDSQGCVILVGFSEGASNDYYVAKVKADGTGLSWPAASYDHGGGLDTATAVAVDTNDDIIVTGYGHNGSNYDIHTIKYSGTDGAVLWQNTYAGAAGGNDFANAIAVDALNNIYVGGTMQNGSGEDDFVIVKYAPAGPNPDGTPMWSVPFNGAADGHDRLTAIAAGPDGIAVTGESESATPGDFDCLTHKLAFDGTFAWPSPKVYADVGNGKGQAVALDGAGNVLMTGYVNNAVGAGSGLDMYTVRYPAGGGAADWVKLVDGGAVNDSAQGTAIFVDAAGNVYATGWSAATGTTNKDVFVAKYAGATGSTTAPDGWSLTYNSGNGNNDVPAAIFRGVDSDVFVTGFTNDGVGGPDDILTLKVCRDHGNLLWDAARDAGGLHDRGVGVGLGPAGEVLVGGWSDTAANGYDFTAISYDPGALDPPTGLSATTVSPSEIALAWTENAAGEDNVVIERKTGAAGEWGVVTDTLPPDTESYNDTGLTADTRFFYRSKVISAADGSSPWSNEADASTTVISYDLPAWLHTFAGAAGGDDEPASIAVGPDNHPVVTGFSFAGAIDGGYDYYTFKLDRSDAATTQWAERYNDDDNESDYAKAVAVDSANRVIVSGYASLYGGGAGNTNDVYTLGYPAGGGTPTWSDQYNGPAGDDDRSEAVATAVDGSDNVAVVGYGKNATPDDDIYVLKYDSAGTRMWAATPFDGGGLDQPAAVAFDPGGDIFVVGRTYNGADFDFFVAKYNGSDGSLAWGGTHRSYDGAGSGDDYAEAAVVDAAGDLYVTGYSYGSGGSGDIVVVKYEGATGNIAAGWPQVYDGGGYDKGAALALDAYSNEVVVGGTTFVGAGNHDIHLRRYEVDGTLVWEKTIDLPGSDEAATAMGIDRTGIVTVTGGSNDGSGEDILAVKVDYTGLIVGANLYDGAAGNDDLPADVAVNAYGEAFVAGSSINAGNNTDMIIFKADGGAMQAPYPVSATQLYTQADLSWTDNSLDETGFRIERMVGACSATNPWNPVTETAVDATSYLDSGLNIGSTYCYRIQSFNGSGEASRWNEVEVTTDSPVPPDGLTATVLNTTDVRLEWNDNTDNESAFTLERCSGSGCTFLVVDPLPVAAEATSYVDTTACEGQTYRYRIKALKSGQWVTADSPPTGDVTTDSRQAPSGLGSDWVSEEWAELKWTDNSADETEFLIERCTGAGCSDFGPLGTLISPSGPLLHYRMDEAGWAGVAGEVIDLSPEGNHGTAAGATTVTAGRYAAAGSFDGTNDYVTTPLTIDQSATSPGATFSAWVYPESVSANNHFVIATDNGGNDWALLRNGATWYVGSGADGALVNTGVAVDAGIWQHLAVVFDPAAGVTLYKNGSSVWSDPGIDFDDSAAAVTLGRRGSLNQEFFDGRLDEVSVFDNPLGAADILALYDHGLARYNDTSVAHSTVYNYRVSAKKSADCTWTSLPSAAHELTATPPAPSDLSATVVDSGRIFLSWTDNTTSETGFKIERCQGSGCADFAEVTTLAADAVSYFDSGLCADPDLATTYNYRVTALKDLEWSTAPSVAAEAAIPALATPTALAVASISEEQAVLEWDYPSTDLDGFKVARCDGDVAFCASDVNFGTPVTVVSEPAGQLMLLHMDEEFYDGTAGEVLDASGNANHGTTVGGAASIAGGKYIRGGSFDGSNDYITTPLNLDQSGAVGATFEAWVNPDLNTNSYKFVISTDNGGSDWGLAVYANRWYVVNGSGTYNTSQTVTFNDWQHMVLTFDPSWGVRLYRNGTQIWSNASIGFDANDYNVTIGRQGSSGNYFSGLLDEVAVYDRVLSGTEISERYQRHFTWSESGLPHSSPYSYRVWAYKDAGCAWESNPDEVATATLTPPMPAPFNVTMVGSTRIDLDWTDIATSETAYHLQRCMGAGCSDYADLGPLLGADTESYSDTTVCEGQTYRYQLRAEKSDGPIWQSPWASGEAATPDATMPGNFTATTLSESEIALSWDDTTFDEDEFVIERCQSAAFDCGTPIPVVNSLGSVMGSQLHYRMDEALWNNTVDEVVDASGKGRHGRAYGAITDGNGKYDRGGYFDGSNDYVLTPLTIDQTSTGPGATYEAWVKPTVSTTAYRAVFSTENGGNDWGLLHYNGLWYVSTGEGYRSTGVAVDLNAWQHVAVVFSPGGAAIKFYKNSAETTLNVAYIGYDSSTNPLYIGRRANSTYYYAGYIDEAAVYNKPLTQAEIDQHYQSQIDVFAHTDTGLNPGLPYTYQIKGVKSADCSWETPPAMATATTDSPPPPTGLAIAVTDTTTLDLTWTDNSGSETNYHVQRCTGSGTACDEATEFATLDNNLPPNTTSFTDDSVSEGATYTYWVRAEKDDGPPNWQTTWEGPLSETTTSKEAPTGLSATRISEARIDLSWSDTNDDETGFKIERCAGAGCSNFVEVAIAEGGSTSYVDDQVAPDTTYTYQVRAYKTAIVNWDSGYTNTAEATTTVIGPDTLSAAAVDTTTIDLSWTDNSGSETGTIIERCAGAGCSSFSPIGEVGTGETSYTDTTVANGTSYSYRVKAVNEGLSSDGGGNWTRRVPVSFTGFVPNATFELVVPFAADMRSDFGDLRFFDQTAGYALPYQIVSKTDGVTATVNVSTRSNDAVYMYYGNPSATDASVAGGMPDVYTFPGSTIDAGQWVEIDPDNSIAQNDGLILNDVADGWNRALISQATYSRQVDRELYLDLSIPADTAGNNHFMVGWELNQIASVNYNQLVHGFYWNNYALTSYEKGTNTGGAGTYAASTDYEMKVVLKAVGAKYYIRGGAYADWTLVQETSTYSDATMRLAFHQYSHQATIHKITVTPGTVRTGASLGAEEASAAYSFANTWSSGYSNVATDTTPAPVAPTGLAATAVTHDQIDLVWTDTTDDETGFKIERCVGIGCSDFGPLGTVGAGVTNYSDPGLSASTYYNYRVRAYKTTTQSWDGPYCSADGALSMPQPASGLTASALNSRMIRLDWVDNGADEDGFEIEVKVWNGRFILTKTVDADVTTFTDHVGIDEDTEYVYRVRPYRGSDKSPYSNEEPVTTPPYLEGDSTCVP